MSIELWIGKSIRRGESSHYNGFLFASFNLAARNSDKFALTIANFGAVAALASCLVLLYLMIFELGTAQNYESASSDFNATSMLCGSE